MNNSCYLKPKVISNTMRNKTNTLPQRASIESLSNTTDIKENNSVEYANECLLSSFNYNPINSVNIIKNNKQKRNKTVSNISKNKSYYDKSYISQLENELQYQRNLINSIKISLVSILILYYKRVLHPIMKFCLKYQLYYKITKIIILN